MSPILLNQCKAIGCKEKVRHWMDSYCPKHLTEKSRLYDTTRQHAAFYNSRSWKNTKTMKMNTNPLCERCLSEKKIKSTEMVHHITSLDDGGESLEMSNLQSLCYQCHAILTAEKMKGKV